MCQGPYQVPRIKKEINDLNLNLLWEQTSHQHVIIQQSFLDRHHSNSGLYFPFFQLI